MYITFFALLFYCIESVGTCMFACDVYNISLAISLDTKDIRHCTTAYQHVGEYRPFETYKVFEAVF